LPPTGRCFVLLWTSLTGYTFYTFSIAAQTRRKFTFF